MGFTVSIDREACNGCEECLEVCTTDVLEMRSGKAALVHAEECIGCESCVEICEQKAICVEETGVEMSDTCKMLLKDIL